MVDAWTHTKSVTYVYFKYLLFQPLHIGFKGQINEVDDMKLLQNPCNQRKLWIKKYLKNLLLFSWSSMNSVDTRLLHSFICLFLFVFFFKINKSLTTSSSVSLNLLSAWSLVSWGLSLGKTHTVSYLENTVVGWQFGVQFMQFCYGFHLLANRTMVCSCGTYSIQIFACSNILELLEFQPFSIT